MTTNVIIKHWLENVTNEKVEIKKIRRKRFMSFCL